MKVLRKKKRGESISMPKATKIEEAAAATGQHMLHVDARRSGQASARREGSLRPTPGIFKADATLSIRVGQGNSARFCQTISTPRRPGITSRAAITRAIETATATLPMTLIGGLTSARKNALRLDRKRFVETR